MTTPNGFAGDGLYRIVHCLPPFLYVCQDLPSGGIAEVEASGQGASVTTRPLNDDTSTNTIWRITKVYDGWSKPGLADPPRYTIENYGSGLYATGIANPLGNPSDHVYVKTYKTGQPVSEQLYRWMIKPSDIPAPGTELDDGTVQPGPQMGVPNMFGTYRIEGTAGGSLQNWPNPWAIFGSGDQGVVGEALQLDNGSSGEGVNQFFLIPLGQSAIG